MNEQHQQRAASAAGAPGDVNAAMAGPPRDLASAANAYGGATSSSGQPPPSPLGLDDPLPASLEYRDDGTSSDTRC